MPHCNDLCVCNYQIDDQETVKKYKNFLDQGHFLDFELRSASGTNFYRRQVHKLVAYAALHPKVTEFFKKPENVWRVDGIYLDMVVEFAYTREIQSLAEDHVVQLLTFAKRFDCHLLKVYLYQFMKANLRFENCLLFQSLADHLCSSAKEFFRSFILKKDFKKLNEVTSGFSRVSNAQLEDLIKDDSLGINEAELFNIVMDWIKESESRRPFLKHIRYNWMHDSEILAAAGNLIRWVPHPMQTSNRPRWPNEITLFVGGWAKRSGPHTGQGSPTSQIEVYDNRRKSVCRQMQKPFGKNRAYHGLEVIGDVVYVFGGYEYQMYHKDLSAYDIRNHQWFYNRANMTIPRCYVASTTLGGYLYAIGGFSGEQRESSGERYDPESDTWSLIPNMEMVRSDAACVAFKNKVYVIGGFDGHAIHDTVEIFDPQTQQWTFGPRLNTQRSGVNAIVYHDKIFVIGGFNGVTRLRSVEVLDPRHSANWQISDAQLNCGRSNFAVTVNDDKILVAGGYDGVGVTDKMETFDEISNRWKQNMVGLRTKKSAHSAITLKNFTVDFRDFVPQSDIRARL